MSRFESDGHYTRTAILLHWIVAAILIVQFAWGWGMQEIPKTPPGMRAWAFNVHKSFGLVLLALTFARLAWRWTHHAPPLTGLPAWHVYLARTTQWLLYAALIVMPFAGYLGSVFSGYPIKWFGITLPAWGWKDDAIKDAMSRVHLIASFVLAGATVLHVSGAITHAVARDGITARMRLRLSRS
jgi:cytochrome b561